MSLPITGLGALKTPIPQPHPDGSPRKEVPEKEFSPTTKHLLCTRHSHTSAYLILSWSYLSWSYVAPVIVLVLQVRKLRLREGGSYGGSDIVRI